MIVLKILDLSKNLITKIQFNNTIWPSIALIVMDNNDLTFIKISDLRASGKVVVKVQGNPWHCDMELCWLSGCRYRMGRREAFWYKCLGSWKIQLLGEMICNSPQERKNIAIKKSGKNS